MFRKRKLSEDDADNDVRIKCCFKSLDTGNVLTNKTFELSLKTSVNSLESLCNNLLNKDEAVPLAFYINDVKVIDTLKEYVKSDFVIDKDILEIVYQQQAVFKVRAVTRCTGSLEGHKEPVLTVLFSPDGKHLASGSGDTTVRFWDVYTQTPHFTCEGHKDWILCLSWSPCGSKLASAAKNGSICLWDPVTGKQIGKTMTGHKKWVTTLSWEPYHKNPECQFLASASKDGDVRIWDTKRAQTSRILSSHSKSVTCVKWGGNGLIYSCSQDRTIKVWRAEDGVLCRTLEGHAHWVNSLALNVDYVLRTGPFNPITNKRLDSLQHVIERYEMLGEEKLVSASDDFTLFLWRPEKEKKPIARMTGHQQLVNDVKFSPNSHIIASASFDKSIKLWNSNNGIFMGTLRGHVKGVYLLAWSADSRLLVSCSGDSTVKVWEVNTKRLLCDLPGHADEVYAIDWSPDSLRVASGGKDKILRIWQN